MNYARVMSHDSCGSGFYCLKWVVLIEYGNGIKGAHTTVAWAMPLSHLVAWERMVELAVTCGACRIIDKLLLISCHQTVWKQVSSIRHFGLIPWSWNQSKSPGRWPVVTGSYVTYVKFTHNLPVTSPNIRSKAQGLKSITPYSCLSISASNRA